ncbi:MAG: hypothetical protein CBC25_01110 [Pelagibacteraceae bacterium TMED65]|nr:MAG: hypothetical protein CBC25_01110 [Pelagibacteraceae bacterium TMED65]
MIVAGQFNIVDGDTIVFCDSKAALEWAFQNSLPKSTKIYTSASSILSSRAFNGQNLEKIWTPERLTSFRDCVHSTSLSISRQLLRSDYVCKSDALLVSSSFVGAMNLVYKAGCLDEKDVKRTKIIIDFEKLGPRDRNLVSLWPKIFDGMDNTKTVKAPLILPHFSGLTVDGVSFWRRLGVAGVEGVLFRLFNATSFVLKNVNLFKKRGLIYNPNELVQEVTVNLFMRGEVLVACPSPTEIGGESHTSLTKMMTICSGEIKPFLCKWVPPSLVDNCAKQITNRIADAVKNKHRYENFFLNLTELRSSDYIISGALASIEGRALSSVASRLGIPLIACHHGITHEINDAVSIKSAGYDDALSDLTVTHTKLAATHLEKQSYSRGKRFAAGLPKRVFRTNRRARKSQTNAKALYISTFLLNGNSSAPLVSGAGDWVSDNIEAKLVKEALSRTKVKLDFKPYPEEYRRFTEPSLATTYASNSENITVVSSSVDARFIIQDYQMLITSGATSTLGWAFASNKPLIFINWKAHLPINPPLAEEFSNALFYFDGDATDFHEELRYFLEKDIAEIRELWDARKTNRSAFCNKYISEKTRKVGGLIADEIQGFVNSCRR